MRAASELAAEMLPPGVVAVSPDGGDAGTWGGMSIARAAIGADEGRARRGGGRTRSQRLNETGDTPGAAGSRGDTTTRGGVRT